MHNFNADLVYGVSEISTEIRAPLCIYLSVRSLKWFRGIMCDSSKSAADAIYSHILGSADCHVFYICSEQVPS